MAFTEFVCRSGGSNLNGGHLNSNAEPATSAVYTCVNSNWNGVSVFTPTDGSTPASTVTVGDMASVYNDGATVAVYIGRVTVVAAGVNGAITLSTTAVSGTAPTNSANGRSIKVGGAWLGPNAAENFPFGFLAAATTNAAGDRPRVNFKNDAQYNVTAAISHSLGGPVVWSGYTTTFGDQGQATIDGGTGGASYALFTNSGATHEMTDFVFANNGGTGSATGVTPSGSRTTWRRCVIHNMAGFGIAPAVDCRLQQVEVYKCNLNNTSALGGVSFTGGWLLRCTIHDNDSGSNCHGIVDSSNAQPGVIQNCIIESNAGNGILKTVNGSLDVSQTEFYNNSVNGILINNITSDITIENCNFLKNTTAGINITTATSTIGQITNCGFGTGTQANGTDIINGGQVTTAGTVNYASGVTPWVAPTTGNFTITLPAAINAGNGTFTETQASYTGTVGYPVIGAAQALVSALLSVGLAALRLIGVGRF